MTPLKKGRRTEASPGNPTFSSPKKSVPGGGYGTALTYLPVLKAIFCGGCYIRPSGGGWPLPPAGRIFPNFGEFFFAAGNPSNLAQGDVHYPTDFSTPAAAE